MTTADRRHDAGKGDSPRPVDKKKYDKNYERIFGKKGKASNGRIVQFSKIGKTTTTTSS